MAKEKENILNLEFTDFLNFINAIIDCIKNISGNEDYDDESVEDFKSLLKIYAFYLLGKDSYPNIDIELSSVQNFPKDDEEEEDYIKYNKDKHLLN